MGLYDDVVCEMDHPAAASGIEDWKTRDLNQSMKTYAIKADGRLVDTQTRMEPKPGAPKLPEISSPDYLAVYREWWERKQGPDLPEDYTGPMELYGQAADGVWWELEAQLEGGRCVGFRLISPQPESNAPDEGPQ